MTLTRAHYGWLAGVAGAAFATWWWRRAEGAAQRMALGNHVRERGETIFTNHPVAD